MKTWKPTLILDVGLNYGEILFSTSYDPDATIIGIEANQLLFPYLKKTWEAHPNQSQITLINALAAQSSDEEKTFYVDKYWSGTSSAVPMVKHSMVEVTQVKTISIDSLFADRPLFEDRLQFKLDVEGYEEYVLKGMSRLTSETNQVIGYIEFNEEWMAKAGTDVQQFLMYLDECFDVYLHQSADTILRFQQLHIDVVRQYFNTYRFTDLLLVSKGYPVESFGLTLQTIS